MRKRSFTWAIIILLLPILACGLFGGDDDESGPGKAPAGAKAPAEAPAEAVAEEETVAEKVEEVVEAEPEAAEPEAAEPEPAESETVEFAGVTGLDEFSSYRVIFVMDFDGTSGGQPAVGHIEMSLESTKEPPARHLSIEMEGSPVADMGGANQLEFYDVGGTIYMYTEAMGDQWISMPGSDDDAFSEGFFAPDEDLELPKTAQCSSELETINNIPTRHCTFSEADVVPDEESYEDLRGDIWLAVDGNYIVKYQLEADGYSSNQGDMEDLFDFGSVSFLYELSEVNAELTITPPEEALNAPSLDFGGDVGDSGGEGDVSTGDLPVLDDAEELFSAAGFVTYYTQSDIAAAVDFYRQELTALGWIEDTDSAYSDETVALLSFEKEGSTLTLTLGKEDDGRVNVGLITAEQ